MCTTIGFKYNEGVVFGRTLEMSTILEHKILYVPRGNSEINQSFPNTKYAVLGTGFTGYLAFGDGVNEVGLMGSYNFFPMNNKFASESIEGKLNMITDRAFNLMLTTCRSVEEVKQLAQTINLLGVDPVSLQVSSQNHFFFMDATGAGIVLEPQGASFKVFDNPYGVLTNAPEFDYHTKNLSNYINLSPIAKETEVKPYGLGSGMLGIPGDFTPASRFIRAWYFVSNTAKDLKSQAALQQAFRILGQFDIPDGAVRDTHNNRDDITLYTAVMDAEQKTYHLKCRNNSTIQSFNMNDYGDQIVWIDPVVE